MATTGKINGTATHGSGAGTYEFWADWKLNSSSAERNTSNITVFVRLKCTSSANSVWSLEEKARVTLRVGGVTKTPVLDYIDTRNNATSTFATWTGDVPHNPDGSLSCEIYVSFMFSAGDMAGSLKGNAVLPTIDLASVLVSAVSLTGDFAGMVSMTYDAKNASVFTQCRVELVQGSSATSLKTVPQTNYGVGRQSLFVTLDDNERELVYKRLTSASSGVLRFALLTYTDENCTYQIGNQSTRELTLRIPENDDTRPSVSMTLTPVNAFNSAFDGLFIKGKSKLRATLTATPKYNTKINNFSISYGSNIAGSTNLVGNASTVFDYTSNDPLDVYGQLTVNGSATDNRGFTGSVSPVINVIDYAKPRIEAEVYRCDSSGNQSDNGTYLKIKAKRNFSKVVASGVQKNFCAVQYRVKQAGGEYGNWTTILDRTAASDEVTTAPLLGNLSTKSSYVVQVQAVDDIGEIGETVDVVSTGVVYMHRTKNSMALGKYVESENMLDVAWDAHFHGEVYIGDTKMTLREYILSIMSEGG